LENTDKTERRKLSRRDRFWLAAAGIGLLVLLAVAAMLKPSESGYGTHRQLGLPPCTFWVLFGRPCPTCGMTTAWAHLMRGQLRESVRANLGGTLLGLLAIMAGPWMLGSAIRGDWLVVSPSGRAAAWILIPIVVVTLIDWVIRLWAG
jgi:hypothetical protein